ncbi:MAG TPA: uroporphyrinogen decarboxylase family protein [Candidatus Methanomethylophilaceae archaeon]|nr:uroporphyrinogen decarboxylase family protein [Candidatus Methanomethylophilaceae archaeon]
MKDAGHRDAVEAALNFESIGRTPVNNFAVVTAAHSAGYTVTQARNNPLISAKVSVDYAMKTRSDFVKPVLDSQVPFVDLGAKVRFPEDDYGMVPDPIVSGPDELDELAIFDPFKASECPGFTNVFVKSLEETARIIPEDLHICGLSWGPLTMAGYLMGAENMMFQMITEPDSVKNAIKKVTNLVTGMEQRMLEAGATVMWMADPTSSEDLISKEMFREYSYEAISSVIKDTKSYRDVPAFVHICGNTLNTMSLLKEMGTDCFSFDHAVNPAAARKSAGNMALMGNVEPVSIMMKGTPERVKEESYRVIEAAGLEGGLILAPGCEMPLKTPDENAIMMGESARSYWQS